MSNINNLSCKNNKYRTDYFKEYDPNYKYKDVDFGYKDIKNSDNKYKRCDCNLLNKDEKKFIKNKNYNIKPESIKCAEAKYKFRYLYNNKKTSKNPDVKKRQEYYKRILLDYCNSNPYSCSKTDKYNMPKKIDEICGPKYLNVCDKSSIKISDIPKDALKYFGLVTKSISDIEDRINIKNIKKLLKPKIKTTKKNISNQQKIKEIKIKLQNIENFYKIYINNINIIEKSKKSKKGKKDNNVCNKYRDFNTVLKFMKEYIYATNVTPQMNKIYSCIYKSDLLYEYIELELELEKLQGK